MPVYTEATFLFLPNGTLSVVEECSGWSALFAGGTIALVLAYLSSSWRRRVLLLAVTVPLAVASNVLRITILALLSERYGYEILKTPVHVLSGYFTFVLTLVLIMLFAERSRSPAT